MDETKEIVDIVDEVIEDSVAEIATEENEEKDAEKVTKKYNKTKKNTTKKEQNLCEVLVYNERKHFVVVSIDGNGVRIYGIEKNPGKYMKYTGKIGSPDFSVEMM